MRVLKTDFPWEKNTPNERNIMPVPKELLEILACPICREEVQPTADGDGLKCIKCGRIYPVRDDIPIMLADEAVIGDI